MTAAVRWRPPRCSPPTRPSRRRSWCRARISSVAAAARKPSSATAAAPTPAQATAACAWLARTVEFVASTVGCKPEEVLVASTGVIGVDLDLKRSRAASPRRLRRSSRDGSHDATLAIMTTDPFPKEAAARVETSSGTFHVGGMAKGSGMIEPMMATMLGFLTCDAVVEPAVLAKALRAVVRDTFNAITVDGECSTNDTRVRARQRRQRRRD